MGELGNRSLAVGDKVKHHGAEGEVVAVATHGKSVKVTFPYTPSRRAGWISVGDLQRLTAPVSSPADTPLTDTPLCVPTDDLYPIDTLLTNEAGETVKVIGRWKTDVKLQAGSGANLTDFSASGEAFTLSEQDVHLWLQKANQPQKVDEAQLHTWGAGERARLLCDLPHDQYPLDEGDEGTVAQVGNDLGFKADRYRGATVFRTLNGKQVYILDHCEAVVADDAATPDPSPEPGGEINEHTFKALRRDNVQLQRALDSAHLDLTVLHRELDKYQAGAIGQVPDEIMKAIEDAGKLTAELADARKKIQRLEATNQQQVKLLKTAATPLPNQANLSPDPAPLPMTRTAHIDGEGRQKLRTLMTMGGGGGFNDVEIPQGYQIAAITTEIQAGNLTPQLYRFTHLIGCEPSPTTLFTDEKTEPIPSLVDEHNSFEDLLRGNALVEDVIAAGNAEVLAVARQAADERLSRYRAASTEERFVPSMVLAAGGQA